MKNQVIREKETQISNLNETYRLLKKKVEISSRELAQVREEIKSAPKATNADWDKLAKAASEIATKRAALIAEQDRLDKKASRLDEREASLSIYAEELEKESQSIGLEKRRVEAQLRELLNVIETKGKLLDTINNEVVGLLLRREEAQDNLSQEEANFQERIEELDQEVTKREDKIVSLLGHISILEDEWERAQEMWEAKEEEREDIIRGLAERERQADIRDRNYQVLHARLEKQLKRLYPDQDITKLI